GNLTSNVGRIHVNVEIPRNGVESVADILLSRRQAGAVRVRLDLQRARARPTRFVAITDAILVEGNREEQFAGVRHGLRTGHRLAQIEHVFLEELERPGVLLAIVNGNRGLVTADLAPVPDPAGEDLFELVHAELPDRIIFVDVHRESIQAYA